jgi:aldehyde dehydrogenase (NAD+)
MTIPRYDHFINGAVVAPSGGEYMDVHNPANGEVIAQVACGTAQDVDAAVAAAQAAFDNPAWRDQTPAQRAALINQFIAVIKANAQELAYLEIISSGATVSRVGSLDEEETRCRLRNPARPKHKGHHSWPSCAAAHAAS